MWYQLGQFNPAWRGPVQHQMNLYPSGYTRALMNQPGYQSPVAFSIQGLRGMGADGDPPAAVEPTPEPTPEPTTTGPWMLSTPIALQAFSIASGVAGGLAGFVLASRLQNSLKVSASQVIAATGLSVIATFGAIFVIRTIHEWPSA